MFSDFNLKINEISGIIEFVKFPDIGEYSLIKIR